MKKVLTALLITLQATSYSDASTNSVGYHLLNTSTPLDTLTANHNSISKNLRQALSSYTDNITNRGYFSSDDMAMRAASQTVIDAITDVVEKYNDLSATKTRLDASIKLVIESNGTDSSARNTYVEIRNTVLPQLTAAQASLKTLLKTLKAERADVNQRPINNMYYYVVNQNLYPSITTALQYIRTELSNQ